MEKIRKTKNRKKKKAPAITPPGPKPAKAIAIRKVSTVRTIPRRDWTGLPCHRIASFGPRLRGTVWRAIIPTL